MKRISLIGSLGLLATLVLADLWFGVYGDDPIGFGFIRFGLMVMLLFVCIPLAIWQGWNRRWSLAFLGVMPALYGWSIFPPLGWPAYVTDVGFHIRLALNESRYQAEIDRLPNTGKRSVQWDWVASTLGKTMLIYDETDFKDGDPRLDCTGMFEHLKGHFYLCGL